MGKRKKEEVKQGAAEWMTTFSDLMTLIMCFFILMFAMSTLDTAKINAVAASMSNKASTVSVFDVGSDDIMMEMMGNGIIEFPIPPSSLVEGSEDEDKKNGPQDYPAVSDYETQRLADAYQELSQISDDLRTYFAEFSGTGENGGQNLAEGIQVEQGDFEIKITLQGGVTFESGTHVLTEDAKETLAVIARVLLLYPENDIHIEGHTDSRPIHTTLYPDNEILSFYRAREVMRFFVEYGLDQYRLFASGLGELRPVGDNDTEEGRAENRRVEIKILSTK